MRDPDSRYKVEWGNTPRPNGWDLAYLHDPDYVPEWDNENVDGMCQPETGVSEPAFKAQRAHSGDHSFKLFGYGRIFDTCIYRRVRADKWQQVTASIWAHAWSSLKDDDPKQSTGVGKGGFSKEVGTTGLTDAQRNITFYIGIDPTGGKDPLSDKIIWSKGRHIYNVWDQIEIEAIADPADAESGDKAKVTVFVRMTAIWRHRHNDCYLDDFECTVGDAEPEPEEPEPPVVVGASPKMATIMWDNEPTTVDTAAIDDFFTGHYPATSVFHILYDNTTPDPEPEEPEEPEYIAGLHPLGFHVQDIIGIEKEFKSYVAHVKPGIIKLVGNPGLAKTIKELSPETRVVYRHYATAREQDAYLSSMNPLAWTELLARDIAGWEQYIDFVESLNEVLKSNDAVNMARVVEFERGFISALRVLGMTQKPVIFCAAVGNPHESQFADMIPAVRDLVEAGGAIGYHAYWWANKDADGLLDWWPYHAGRWQEMDRAFAAAGLKPLYILGEAGVLGSKDGGEHLLPEDGWREWMELPEYLEDLQIFTDLVDEWNEEHGGRCLGAALFTLNKSDWKSFNFKAGEIHVMEEGIL